MLGAIFAILCACGPQAKPGEVQQGPEADLPRLMQAHLDELQPIDRQLVLANSLPLYAISITDLKCGPTISDRTKDIDTALLAAFLLVNSLEAHGIPDRVICTNNIDSDPTWDAGGDCVSCKISAKLGAKLGLLESSLKHQEAAEAFILKYGSRKLH